MNEYDFILNMQKRQLVTQRVSGLRSSIAMGIGDDTAVLDVNSFPSPRLLVTTDMLIDRRHFDLATDQADLIGRKCLAVNLSDIAAMGGVPFAALCSINFPQQGIRQADVEKFSAGFMEIAEEYEVELIGGDTNASDAPFCVSVTVLGYAHQKGGVLRSGAKEGDLVVVTGSLGGSINGKHFRFRPRVREMQTIMDQVQINSAIDLSDGLGTDLLHICYGSQLKAKLELEKLPISPSVCPALNNDERTYHAMCDGEDFEICFTVSKDALKDLQNLDLGCSLTVIGEMVSGRPQIEVKTFSGQWIPWQSMGFAHEWAIQH